MSEDKGCGRSAAEIAQEEENKKAMQNKGEEAAEDKEVKVLARVGAPAPDFKTDFYFKGKFGTFTLSDHLGSWVMLCFYPGDFTFV